MGIFSFFKKKQSQANQEKVASENANPDSIADNVFKNSNDPETGIEALYAFMQFDYESRGYNDALTNPDESYKLDNIRLMQLDLQILIDKVNTYYNDLENELNLHIATRSRAGLIDLVQELETRKVMVNEHRSKVAEIKADMEKNNNSGMNHRIVLSYQRGFMRGLSAISQSRILNKRL